MKPHFLITYANKSTRTVELDDLWFLLIDDYTKIRVSFKYMGPNKVDISDDLLGRLSRNFLPYFNTNPFLWELSISTCPEELRPYLILPSEQLTYKGTA